MSKVEETKSTVDHIQHAYYSSSSASERILMDIAQSLAIIADSCSRRDSCRSWEDIVAEHEEQMDKHQKIVDDLDATIKEAQEDGKDD